MSKRATATSTSSSSASVACKRGAINGELGYVPNSRRSRSCKDKVTSVGDYIRTVMQQLQSGHAAGGQSSSELAGYGGSAGPSANNRLAYNSRQGADARAAPPPITSSRATRTARNTPSSAATSSSSAEQQVWLMIVERMREEIIKARDVHRANLYNQSFINQSFINQSSPIKRRRVLCEEELQKINGADQPFCSVCNPNNIQSAAVGITVCGHYLCWACLCKWHHKDATSSLTPSKKECPCCKKILSKSQVRFVGAKHEEEDMEDDVCGGGSNYLSTDQRDKLLEQAAIPILTSRLQANLHEDLQSVYKPALLAISGLDGSIEAPVYKPACPSASGHGGIDEAPVYKPAPLPASVQDSSSDEASVLSAFQSGLIAMSIDKSGSPEGRISSCTTYPSLTAYSPLKNSLEGTHFCSETCSLYESLRVDPAIDKSMSKQLPAQEVALLTGGGNPNITCEKQVDGVYQSTAQLNIAMNYGCSQLEFADGGLRFITPTADHGGASLRQPAINAAMSDLDVFQNQSGHPNDARAAALLSANNNIHTSRHMEALQGQGPTYWSCPSPLDKSSTAKYCGNVDMPPLYIHNNWLDPTMHHMSQFNSEGSSSYDLVYVASTTAEIENRGDSAEGDSSAMAMQCIQSLLEIQATDETEVNELRQLQGALKQQLTYQQKPLNPQSSAWLSTLLANTSAKYSDEYILYSNKDLAPFGYNLDQQTDLQTPPQKIGISSPNINITNDMSNVQQMQSQFINSVVQYSSSPAEQLPLNFSSESTFNSASVSSNNSSSTQNHFNDNTAAVAACPQYQDEAISNWRSLYDLEAWDWPL